MKTGRWIALAAVAALLAPAASRAQTVVAAFPSAGSQVVGSVGIIDDASVGYFWSAARGDRVAQTFSGPDTVDGAQVRIGIPENVLQPGAHVDWDLVVNSVVVGSVSVAAGQKTISLDATFPPIDGPAYVVHLRVTNEVGFGEGSISLAYAGSLQHEITLHRTDCASGGLTGPALVGADRDEDGPVSATARGLEGAVAPADPVLHEAGCAAAFAGA